MYFGAKELRLADHTKIKVLLNKIQEYVNEVAYFISWYNNNNNKNIIPIIYQSNKFPSVTNVSCAQSS